MNIFYKVTLQSLKKNRTRTLVTIAGVVLSAALITGVATFAVSLQSYLVNGAAAKYGGWHIEIPDADAAFAREQAEDPRTAETITLQNIGYAALPGGENPAKPYLFLSGWSGEAFDSLPVKLLAGRLPENGGEVLIPAHVAANGGVKISIGDTLTLAVGSRVSGGLTLGQHDPYPAGSETLVPTAQKTYTVVGICQRPGIEEYEAPGYTLITVQDPDAPDRLTVFVTLKNPYQLHSYADSLPDGKSYVFNDDVLRFLGLSGEKIMTVLLYAVGGILIALVMLGSVFLIYNSFNISLNERTHQFGILMSVGATEKQLRRSVLFEGICIGAVGIPLGILAGIPAIRLVLALVAKNFANVMYGGVALKLVVSVPALAAAAAVSMITILISAWLPARKAAGMPVMACIRETGEIKVDAKAVQTSRFSRRLWELEETLAIKNFKRNKRRYRSIILSLTMSVVLFVCAGSFGAYLDQIAESSSMVVEDYDICFYTRDMAESDLLALYGALKTADGVTWSSHQALSTYACTLPASGLSAHFLDEYGEAIGYDGTDDMIDVLVDIQFVEDGVYQGLLEGLGLSPADYGGTGEAMVMAGFLPGRWYTQEEPMDFTLRSPGGDREITIRATFVTDYPDLLPSEAGEYPGYTLMLIAPYGAKPRFDALNATVKPAKLGMTFQSDNPGQSTAEMRDMIGGAGITADYMLYNLYEILEQNRNLNFIIHLFSVVFIAMISLIAVANVFNTISTNIRLRRREFAMLRSVGMSDRDFNRMMRFECALYGTRTILWSLPLSAVLSYLIYRGMFVGGGIVSFAFPWGGMAVSVAGVFLIVFVTMLYAVDKIKKENIIDALRDEMT